MFDGEIWVDMDILGYQISNTALVRRIYLKVDHERFPPGIRLLPFRSSQRKKGIWYRLSDGRKQKVFKAKSLMLKYFGMHFEESDEWLERTRIEIEQYNDKLRRGKIRIRLTTNNAAHAMKPTKACPYSRGWVDGPAASADISSGCAFVWNFSGVVNK